MRSHPSGEVALDPSLAEVEEVDEGTEDDEGKDQNNQEEGQKCLRKTKTSHLEMTPTNEQNDFKKTPGGRIIDLCQRCQTSDRRVRQEQVT